MNVALRLPNPHSRLIQCIRRLFASGLLLILLALTSQAVHAQNHYPQRTDQYINDYAHLLTSADAASLRNICSDLNHTKGVELVVVTINSMSDYDTSDQTIEPFATHLFNTWGIGDRQRNDGVLLLVAVKDRKVRIEVGSGYGDRYDATMQGVIDEHILPSFRGNNYSQGIVNGARQIAAVLTNSAANTSPAARAPVANISDPAVLASTPSAPVSPLVFLGGGAAALGAAAFGARHYARNRPRRCPHCQAQMARLDKVSSDMYLDSGQKVEKFLNSVDHDVWRCPQCNRHEVYAYKRRFSGLGSCPGCGYRTLRVQERTTVSPTYSSTGLKEVNRDCQHCNYHDTDTVTLAMLTQSDSSSSSSSSSSDSSGGGSSSGGGASGSW